MTVTLSFIKLTFSLFTRKLDFLFYYIIKFLSISFFVIFFLQIFDHLFSFFTFLFSVFTLLPFYYFLFLLFFFIYSFVIFPLFVFQNQFTLDFSFTIYWKFPIFEAFNYDNQFGEMRNWEFPDQFVFNLFCKCLTLMETNFQNWENIEEFYLEFILVWRL